MPDAPPRDGDRPGTAAPAVPDASTSPGNARPDGSRSLITWLAALACAILALTALGFGLDVFAVAALGALLPLPLYVGVALWLDRYEPEPRAMLVLAFLWGASVAVFASGILNAIWDLTLGEAASTVVAVPVTEEVLKALILFRFFLKRPDEFDGVVDGLVYAAMVGLGFAFVENIDYYADAFGSGGVTGLAATFTLRGVIAPFSHPLFSAMTGIGLGLARQTTRPQVRRAAPALGLVAAIGLHGVWNASTATGCVFFTIYLLVMVPALLSVLVVAVLAWRREGRLVREGLAGEVASGQVTADDCARLSSVRGRLHASLDALVRGGVTAWQAERRRHHAASELAFLRHRVARGLQNADPRLEARYLATLTGDSGLGTQDSESADRRPS